MLNLKKEAAREKAKQEAEEMVKEAQAELLAGHTVGSHHFSVSLRYCCQVTEYQVGTHLTSFSLCGTWACLGSPLMNILVSIVGPSQAECLRLERTSVPFNDALEIGLLTDISDDLGSAVHKGLDRIKQSTYGTSIHRVSPRQWNEILLRCFDDALAQWCVVNEVHTIVEGDADLEVRKNGNVINLFVGELSEATAWGIIHSLEPETAFHMIHPKKVEKFVDQSSHLTLDCAVCLIEALRCCKLPVISKHSQ